MKKVLLSLVIITLVLLASCEKNDLLPGNDLLIDQMLDATDKTSIDLSDAPQSITDYLIENVTDTEIDEVNRITDLGYEILFADDTDLYFDESGEVMGPRHRRHRRHGHIINHRLRDSVRYARCDSMGLDSTQCDSIHRRRHHIGRHHGRIHRTFCDSMPHVCDSIRYARCAAAGLDSAQCDSVHRRHPMPQPHASCFVGRPIRVGNLPRTIPRYVQQNYPQKRIRGAKAQRNRNIAVQLTGGPVLLFTQHGRFIRRCRN